MKKLLPLFIVVFLVLGGLGVVGSHTNDTNYLKQKIVMGDQLDQFQETMTEAAIPVGNILIPDNPAVYVQVAQSFIPSLDVIASVELLMGRNSTAAYPLIVSIREELTEPDLTAVEVPPEQFPVEEYDWIVFDFNDIFLEIGKTYYIVVLTANITENYYAWGANNISESYPNGCAWVSIDEGDTWVNESTSSHQSTPEVFYNQGVKPLFDENATWDMCFRTYGRDNILPDAPNINGETNGKAEKEYDYIVSGSDSDGDELYVIIDWGDNTNSGLLGPYSGSYEIALKHSWTEQDVYVIKAKAKDPFGWGPEGTLEVTMPKNKSFIFNFPLLNWLFEHFPNAFPILRYMLGL